MQGDCSLVVIPIVCSGFGLSESSQTKREPRRYSVHDIWRNWYEPVHSFTVDNFSGDYGIAFFLGLSAAGTLCQKK